MEFRCNMPKFPLSYKFFQLTIKISQILTSSMHQIWYNFWIKGSQPEVMSTFGICPFFLLKTSLAALICADGRIFFTPVCHNVMSDQEHGFCPGQGHGDEAQLGKCHLLGGQPSEKDELPASKQHCSLQLLSEAMCWAQLGARPKALAKSCIWHMVWRTEGLQWFAAQMWKNMHSYIICQGRDPMPMSSN